MKIFAKLTEKINVLQLQVHYSTCIIKRKSDENFYSLLTKAHSTCFKSVNLEVNLNNFRHDTRDTTNGTVDLLRINLSSV